jgi:hypothetical protein
VTEFASSDEQRTIVEVVRRVAREAGRSGGAVLSELHARGLVDVEAAEPGADEAGIPIPLWTSLLYGIAFETGAAGEHAATLRLLRALSIWRTPASRDVRSRIADGEFIDVAFPQIGGRLVSGQLHDDGSLTCAGTLACLRSDGSASQIIVPVRAASAGGILMVVLDTGDPSISMGLHPGFGPHAATVDLILDGTRVPEARVLGYLDPDGSAGPGMEAFAACELAVCTELAAMTRAVLDRTVQFTKTRMQFGRPIAEFQAVQHELANMALLGEMALLSVLALARALEESDPAARSLVSVAKYACGEYATKIVEAAIQLHGGIGFTWEAGLQHYLVAVTEANRTLGSPTWHRRWLADSAVQAAPEAAAPQPLVVSSPQSRP